MRIEDSLLEQLPHSKWSKGWYVMAGFIGVALVIIGAIAWKGEGPLVAIKDVSLMLPAAMTVVGFILAVASCALGLKMTQNLNVEPPNSESVEPENSSNQSPPTPPSTMQFEKKQEPGPKKLSNAELENDVRQQALQSYGIEILRLVEAIKANLPDDIVELRKPEYHFESFLDRKDITDPHFIMGLFACEKLLKKGFIHPRLKANEAILLKYLSYFSSIAIHEIHCEDFAAYLKQKKELKAIYEGLLTLQLPPKEIVPLNLTCDDDDLYEGRIQGYFDDLCQELGCDPKGPAEEIVKKIIPSSKLLEKEFIQGLFYNDLFIPYQIIMKSPKLAEVKKVFQMIAQEVLSKERTQETAVAAEIFSVMSQLIKV